MTDIVPIVPWETLGYLYPHGEIHLLSPGNAVVCPGMHTYAIHKSLVLIKPQGTMIPKTHNALTTLYPIYWPETSLTTYVDLQRIGHAIY